YNTNGFAHHRLLDAIDIIAELGYGGVAITPDIHHLDPFAPDCARQLQECSARLASNGIKCVIESGSRFLLDPRHKHQPTLLSVLSQGRRIRLAFLQECVTAAAALGAECVSFWSGTPTEDGTPSYQMARLVEGCKRLADDAARNNVRLAFEPEPGMFIDTMDKFAELHAKVNHPAFGLTVDIGHLVCNGELPVSRFLTDWKHVLWNVHIEDMRRGVHDHVMFGEGEVDFADVFAGLRAAVYAGGVYVELSRHSHDAVNTARKAKAFLGAYGI
ncbi:MAG TPA: sugar phosphate isomerase/epimerase family protein, partial [Urbifossiella sp.]|nr:sugar phosphate isomerase/epimerase family protein [Urbifossiella sp.]